MSLVRFATSTEAYIDMLTWKAIGKNVLVRVILERRSAGEAECGLVVQDNGTIVVEGMAGKLVRWTEGTKVRFLEGNATWIDRPDRLAVVNRDDILCVGEETPDAPKIDDLKEEVAAVEDGPDALPVGEDW